MSTRDQINQSIHDKVIDTASNEFDSKNFDIYKNPGQQKNAKIGNNYPDIIITKKDELTIQFIIEVETKDSVNLDEAKNQWEKYANEINASFYILVPLSSKKLAINLCKQVGISVRFGTYQVDFSGNITNIEYE